MRSYAGGQQFQQQQPEPHPDGLTGTPAAAAVKRVVEVLLDARRDAQEARAELNALAKAVSDYRDAVAAAQAAFDAQLDAALERVHGGN